MILRKHLYIQKSTWILHMELSEFSQSRQCGIRQLPAPKNAPSCALLGTACAPPTASRHGVNRSFLLSPRTSFAYFWIFCKQTHSVSATLLSGFFPQHYVCETQVLLHSVSPRCGVVISFYEQPHLIHPPVIDVYVVSSWGGLWRVSFFRVSSVTSGDCMPALAWVPMWDWDYRPHRIPLFSSDRCWQTGFWSGCTKLHAHQQGRRAPFSIFLPARYFLSFLF